MRIRVARPADAEPVVGFDHVARADADRRAFIQESIEAERCFVCVEGDEVIGYGVLDYTFFRQGSVDMLYVHLDHRRKRAGSALMQHMETLCRTEKLWTSTNLSNLPMQSLLAKRGYKLSGVIHNLDPGDPELVYVKLLG